MYLSSPSGIMDISDDESVLIGTFLCHAPNKQIRISFFWLKALTSVAKVVLCVWVFLIKLAVDHQASDCKYLVFLYTHISRQ